MILLILALFTASAIVFTWPWVDPYLTRHDAAQRLLDRLEEEWAREGEPPEKAEDW